MPYLFTSESVSEGHPDKVADQISDALIDYFLAYDPDSKVACETLVTTGQVVLAGEVKSKAYLDVQDIAREVVKKIGYTKSEYMFEANSCGIFSAIHEQSPDINQGVERKKKEDQGAGDQGIMFGFACDETPDLMPATLYYSHKILEKMAEDRHAGRAPFLEPDAKSQVTLRFEDGKPVAATAIVVSTQHKPGYAEKGEHADPALYAQLRDYVKGVIADVLPADLLSDETVYHINPTGAFEIGGPDGDAGLTGRKIIVDTYGGAAPHGGGAFSGKDPTKVDRSAAYAARYLAKNVVAAGLADKCTLQLSYAIGVSKPLALYVDMQGTGQVDPARLSSVLRELMDLSPRGIREHLGLSRPIYARTSAYGHFGREPEPDGGFSWERTDLADTLRRAF